ncbi:uncharacterized protein MONBRDRAFT_25523 [Monosiga brevicollis MX1]|uniref:Uncharacterized protein n=1 Tax=Monosiga brevicollis TaxID=81824 RepID=A9UZN6_MONBE|nr:uncharacterized protein MONBRDRAFT_25523 [Monosiga brevicollis MX1]EDQ89264.1 predicted protein [Monosiga brevicollis MX1]|eukprot:XP_001745840.1 hypothetical protein [Monosiga brevicollis MX1]
MTETGEGEDVAALYAQRLAQAQDCVARAAVLSEQGVANTTKMHRSLQAELAFLTALSQDELDGKKLKSSNLDHWQAMLDIMEHQPDVVACDKKYTARILHANGQTVKRTHVVDVVTHGGVRWYKVSARNAAALHNIFHGFCAYGQRSLHVQLQELVALASACPVGDRIPEYAKDTPTSSLDTFRSIGELLLSPKPVASSVVLRCTQGITDDLRRACEATGAAVEAMSVPAPLLPTEEESDGAEDDASDFTKLEVPVAKLAVGEVSSIYIVNVCEPTLRKQPYARAHVCVCVCVCVCVYVYVKVEAMHPDGRVATVAPDALNLDVSAMIALVSDVSHGHTEPELFIDPLLSSMAQDEQDDPVLEKLTPQLADRQLLACRTAREAFASILEHIGGPREGQRAKELLERVTQIEDVRSPLMEALPQTLDFFVRLNNKLEAILMAHGDLSLILASHGSGVRCAAITHGGRALTETHKARWLKSGKRMAPPAAVSGEP